VSRDGWRARLRRVRALVLDVDGVLTDGSLYYGPGGQCFKRFDSKDGMGIVLLQKAGVRVAFLSAEETDIVRRRAEKLRVRDVFLGVEDKGEAFERFLRARGLGAAEAAYAGDDVNDLPPLRRAGVAIAVADAVPEVRRAAHWVTSRPGGRGAVREICEAILKFRAGAVR
jgi:3-deoxy-D-manno-octulosonate 8-phosphate phosphatase (KDO 8-P phosphatase)